MTLRRVLGMAGVIALVLAMAPGAALAQEGPPDWTEFGFAKVIGTRKIDPARPQALRVGPYAITIPAGAFRRPVRFEVLAGVPQDFAAGAPKGETPLLAFAFRVTDEETGRLVARFAKRIALIADHNRISRDSKFHNIMIDGSYRVNPAGLRARPGQLRHPIAGAGAWVITVPTPGFASWPYVEPVLRILQRGRVATFVTWLQNNSSENLTQVDIRLRIPEGAIVIKTWAGDPESNRAASDGTSVGWINTSVPAGGLQGPFVMQVNTGGKAVSTSAWIRFKAGTFGGEAVSETVRSRGAVRPGARLTAEALRNAEYPSEFTRSRRARLVEGAYEETIVPGAASKIRVRLSDWVASGDLDRDRLADAAVVLATDPGGSGTFYHLIAVLNRRGAPEPAASVLLGDRVQIRSVSIASRMIVVNMVTQGPGDPMAQPTLEVTRRYRLEGNELKLVSM
ncbi:MAG: hypothetical protein HYX92_13710 [Chloroflexi bacterium]|nr:hypothetical protein [Chloroflexota bacterium]